MNTFGSTKSNGATRRNIIGLFEDDSEKESFLSSAVKSIGSVVEDAVNLVKDEIPKPASVTEIPKAFVDAFKNEPEHKLDPTKSPFKGSIEFNRNNQAQLEQLQKEKEAREEKGRIKEFYQTIKEDTDRAKREKEEELLKEINDIALNLPTDQKNQILHYQASYRDRSIYQLAELRKTLIEQKKKEEKQQKAASIPSPAKQPSAMEGAFEGRSGSQGSGIANLSNQAVG